MKKSFLHLTFASLAMLLLFSSCEFFDVDKTENWLISANVDLGGTFTVTASARIKIEEETFTASISTIKIGDDAGIHLIKVSGITTNDTTLTVSNAQFDVTIDGGTESVTINTATITINENNLEGNGTITVVPIGMTEPVEGTFTLTGEKYVLVFKEKEN